LFTAIPSNKQQATIAQQKLQVGMKNLNNLDEIMGGNEQCE